MRLMVVGAGASFAECKAKGLSDDLCLPLMKDLSRKIWADYNPTPFLEVFLKENGHRVEKDPVRQFYGLEQANPGLIEDFFASAWLHRNDFHSVYGSRWHDLLYHGLFRPLNFILIRGLLQGNPEQRMPLSEAVAKNLTVGDLVLNLNYDLVFDVALKNVGHEVAYSPHQRSSRGIWAFKPHGSFHLVVNEREGSFYYGQVEFIGDAQPADGARTVLGFVPPRKEKSFEQHPVAAMIIAPLRGMNPDVVTFWGIGSPASDYDIFALYRDLVTNASEVEFVNPSTDDFRRVQAELGCKMTHYPTAESWLAR